MSATGNAEAKLGNARTGRFRNSRLLLCLELVIFALIFIADWKGFIPFTKTLFLLALGWISLRLRGMRWKDIGWSVYRTWKHTLAIGTIAGILIVAFELFVSGPLLTYWTGKPADLAEFRPLVGSFKLLLLVLALNWTIAAIGEEFVYRGYLLNRLAEFGKGRRMSWMASAIASSVVFAFAHTYQGVTGVVEAGIDGLLLAVLYLRFDRRLSLPVIAHGVSNTVDLVLIYLGKYPGM